MNRATVIGSTMKYTETEKELQSSSIDSSWYTNQWPVSSTWRMYWVRYWCSTVTKTRSLRRLVWFKIWNWWISCPYKLKMKNHIFFQNCQSCIYYSSVSPDWFQKSYFSCIASSYCFVFIWSRSKNGPFGVTKKQWVFGMIVSNDDENWSTVNRKGDVENIFSSSQQCLFLFIWITLQTLLVTNYIILQDYSSIRVLL